MSIHDKTLVRADKRIHSVADVVTGSEDLGVQCIAGQQIRVTDELEAVEKVLLWVGGVHQAF